MRLLVILLVIFTIAGCASGPVTPPADPGQQPGDPVNPVDPGEVPDPVEPEFDFELHQPNELGEIPVWMYHVIGETEAIWARTPDNFRADLQRFYDLGYRLVSLTDVINNNIDIPAGTSPMVFTFDDGHPSHFRLIKDAAGDLVIDPDSAVGIIMAFAEENPDMGTAATFFVNFPNPFSQQDSWYTTEHRQWKLDKVVEFGMEIGNHTWGHPHLNRDISSADQLVRELGAGQQWLEQMLPGYKMNSLALPFGSRPKEEWNHYVNAGVYEGVEYRHDVVLEVGSVPADPYNHVGYSPLKMPRVRASNFPDGTVKDFLDRALDRLDTTRYISDGDPDIITIPQSMADYLDEDSLGDKELRVYSLDETE